MERPAHLHPPHTSPGRLALCSFLPWEFQGGIVDGLIADPGIRGLTSIVIDSITVEHFGALDAVGVSEGREMKKEAWSLPLRDSVAMDTESVTYSCMTDSGRGHMRIWGQGDG